MARVFISYSSNDYSYAQQVYDVLKANNIDSWFAPIQISSGRDFASEIGSELMQGSDLEECSKHLNNAKTFILLLSKNSMQSKWVRKEIKLAIKKDLLILAVQIDNEPLTSEFEYLLIDVQIIEGYHLNKAAMQKLLYEVKSNTPITEDSYSDSDFQFSESELNVRRITCGDPYYEDGNTLNIEFSGNEFFLAPPADIVNGANLSLISWCKENNFVFTDTVFGDTLDSFITLIPIPDLKKRIDESRKKIFDQFRNRENGCYFNNKKYGVENLNPYNRTLDERESPKLDIQMFITDYFTHRVMKDVCKTLIAEENRYFSSIDYISIGFNKIFLTSLGINLLLLDDPTRANCNTLITSRSINAAETYNSHNFSLSVIEGVSISDYDNYQQKIRLSLAVERGLIEELNVKSNLLKLNTLKFYDVFVNLNNLEIGIFCTIELKKEYGIDDGIIALHGKDETLEISDKRALPISELKSFIINNQSCILPQALYSLCSFLESRGIAMIDRYRRRVFGKQSYICSKYGLHAPCGDKIVDTENFIAIIDGATPKSARLWNNMRGDVFISELLRDSIADLPPAIDAKSAIIMLNQAVCSYYSKMGITLDNLPAEDRLQASVLIYSAYRKEVWSFGDCQFRINNKNYSARKKGDVLLADLRAFCLEAAELKNIPTYDSLDGDYGRTLILPFLKDFILFANSKSSFGYDVINGGPIITDRVKVYAVQPRDHIILASDGYPKLFDTLEETENYLQAALKEDPLCINKLRGTKGIEPSAVSYDDRSFISFVVK